jgi:hypothetical protein
MEMKTIRTSILCFAALLLAAPMLYAQDFSKYRAFSIGTSLATVLKRTNQKLADVKVVHSRPALIQELTWWPPNIPGNSYQSDSVQQMLFSFYNGVLYKISAIYDRASTEGLTSEDMVKSISAKYGPATLIDLPVNFTPNERQLAVASWDDSQNSLSLVRSSFSAGFELTIYSKKLNSEVDLALSEGAKLDLQEGPQREADKQKKEVADLETARQKNIKGFHP